VAGGSGRLALASRQNVLEEHFAYACLLSNKPVDTGGCTYEIAVWELIDISKCSCNYADMEYAEALSCAQPPTLRIEHEAFQDHPVGQDRQHVEEIVK
jgi:hypothetical protein